MKRSILLLLALFCLLWAGPCSAQFYTVTEAELTELDTIFSALEQNNNQLLMGLEKSQTDLKTAQILLGKYRQDLETLRERLTLLENKLRLKGIELVEARSLLDAANRSFEEYAKDTKKTMHRIKRQRNTAWVVVGGVLVLAAAK